MKTVAIPIVLVVIVAALIAVGAVRAFAAPSGDIEKQADAYYAGIEAKVAAHGWACVGVGREENDPKAFTYTVGLTSKGLPEVLTTAGGGTGVQCDELNAVVPWMLAHRDRLRGNAVTREGVRLQPVYPAEFFAHCTFAAMWVARHHLTDVYGMQLVFADKNGTFPD